MLVSCWSAKGGAGTTVVAVALALLLARSRAGGVLMVDLGGDLPSVLGMADPEGPGLADWLAAGSTVPADGLARLEVQAGGMSLLCRGSGSLAHPERAEVLAALLARDGRAVVADCGVLGAVGADVTGAAVGNGTEGEGEVLVGPRGGAARVLVASASESLLVTRPCYLALRRASRALAGPGASLTPSGLVVVVEQGRALDAGDVEQVLGVPVRAEVPCDPAVARVVDAGLMATRLPRSLARSLEGLT